ncbi:hypothetical protein SAOR_12355 [Salinisphaera orenii MK-B5]|uniref:DUF3750 domain-containing protein n=1 Tax=Salinisphaera orenii MK-B5 TaxID=856730 RepID=A0A423PIB8_9GAMM|nr:DUF3750 domain-containing protein [Salinisphaera orenii]ROO25340.1 hypothetical protein SAOR_12355 [Salinisphaera orenii MK-B5]
MTAVRRGFFGLLAIAALALSGPVAMLADEDVTLGGAWYDTDRSSAGLAPAPAHTPEAVVQVYAARTFSWRGLFAVHTWVATKPAGATTYTAHHVTAWSHPALSSREGAPDRRWAGALPRLLLDLRGGVAERAIDHINKAMPEYPFSEYRIWPGPNSNTFTAWLVRKVPELNVELPATAIGKDYLDDTLIAPAPSASGYQLSLHGALGVLAAWDEGIEINLFGLVWGIDPADLAIKWPGVGRLGFDTPWPTQRGLNSVGTP